MAHKFETGLFVRQPAWHGLGVVLQNAPSIAEALTAAGLDWKVLAEPAFLADGTRVPNCQVVRRDSDGKIYSHMKGSYHPLQNIDALKRFQPLLDGGMCTIEAAGALDEGKKIWVLAKVNGVAGEVVKGDTVEKYFLLAHSHDGSLKIFMGETDVRVVCNNTLQVALSDISKMMSRKHTKNAIIDLDKAVESFKRSGDVFQKDLEQFKFLASKKCDDVNLVRYARGVMGGVDKIDTDDDVRHIDEISALFEAGAGSNIPGVRGTMWGAYNAVTEYLTHEAGRSADTRQVSTWFGANARKAESALQLATAFAEHAPDAVTLARECASNDFTASAEFGLLLGKPRREEPVAAE